MQKGGWQTPIRRYRLRRIGAARSVLNAGKTRIQNGGESRNRAKPVVKSVCALMIEKQGQRGFDRI